MISKLPCILGLFLALCCTNHVSAADDSIGTFPVNTPQFTSARLDIMGQARDVWVYRPNRPERLPLMIFYSGTGGTLEFSTLDELGKSAVQEFADRVGVVLVFALPRAINHGDWDHAADALYWQTAQEAALDSPAAIDPTQNPDLVFTRAIIDEASRVYAIDNNRIYLNGFSSGAFFSYFAAAILHEQIAAFAETGGGLVLSQTTGGQPECLVPSVAGEAGVSRNCAASGWTPQICVNPGAIARPLAAEQVDWVPPAFMQANDDDDSVPFVHSCHLANALQKTTESEIHIIHQGGGYIVNAGYLEDSWNFLQSKHLDKQLNQAADRIFNYAAGVYPGLFNPPNVLRANKMSGFVAHKLSGFRVPKEVLMETDRMVTGDPEDEIRRGL